MYSQPDPKHDYNVLRKSVNQIRKYTGSKQPLSDQEWRDFKATAAKVGKAVGAIVLAITGAGAGYYLWKKRSKKDDIKPEKTEQPAVQEEKQKESMQLIALTPEEKMKEAWKSRDWTKVVTLLEQGVNIPKNILNLGGNPLHEMILKHYSYPIAKSISTILNQLPDSIVQQWVNERDKDDATPLFEAMYQIKTYVNKGKEAVSPYLKVIELLVNKGADINALGPTSGKSRQLGYTDEATLLHVAADIPKKYKEEREQVINFLLERGADPTTKDSQGHTYQDILSRSRKD
jgi:hypothetical protein